MIDVFKGIVDQDDAVEQLQVSASKNGRMTNTWLITGPPGSGRSEIAKAFIKLLFQDESHTEIDIDDNVDIHFLSPNTLSIKVQDIRELLQYANSYPSGKYRVFLIEDADRMTITAQNALLKAIEEPAPFAIWILTAPHSADLLPTIRSRARIIHLKTPKTASIAELLISEGFESERAKLAARLADGHIGVARHLVQSEENIEEHTEIANLTMSIRTVADAVFATEKIVDWATISSADSPDDQKKRAQRDFCDISLQRILTVYRDIALLQLGGSENLVVNATVLPQLKRYASSQTLIDTNLRIARISTARERLAQNVLVNLTLEALFTSLLIPERAII